MSTIKEQPETASSEQQPARQKFWIRRTSLQDSDRSFDVEFWQAQTPEARFEAAAEMIRTVDALRGRTSERWVERHIITRKKLTDAD